MERRNGTELKKAKSGKKKFVLTNLDKPKVFFPFQLEKQGIVKMVKDYSPYYKCLGGTEEIAPFH